MSDPATFADEIARAISARIAEIRPSAGYLTDIGARVFRGRLKITPDHCPCVVIVEGDDEIRKEDNHPDTILLRLPFIVEGYSACDPDNPNDAAHEIIRDLKRALLDPARPFDLRGNKLKPRYGGRSIYPREDGLSFVSANVQINVDFSESRANP